MSLIEIFGFGFALIGILLAIRQNKWNWISNMISSIFYFFAFYQVNLVADAYLQFIFLVMSAVGFINWNNAKYASLESVSRLSIKEAFIYSCMFLILTAGIIGYTSKFTPSDYPYWDGTLTASSLVATFMAIKKKLENWWIWILVDMAYIPLYIIKGYLLSGVLYGIYVLLAYVAYKEWSTHLAIKDKA